jgi:hypothetical protein
MQIEYGTKACGKRFPLPVVPHENGFLWEMSSAAIMPEKGDSSVVLYCSRRLCCLIKQALK